jgi:phosphoglycerate dehydrogenase-like enzyme
VLAEPLTGKTVAVIGLGRIGVGVAHRAKAMGMRVVGARRSGAPVPGVDAVYPPGDLHRPLGEADYVVLAVPLTPATTGLMDAKAFDAMRPSAYLVNVSRGRVVDETALVEALRSGRIAGAALDVFAQEPLPPESPLWRLDNVIITPHVGGDMKDFSARSTRLFCENLGRYLRGEPMLNVVDLARGY